MKWIRLTKFEKGFDVTRVLQNSINTQKYVRRNHSYSTGAIIHHLQVNKPGDGLVFKLYQL